MAHAHERLRQAQHDLDQGFLAGAVSIAYYAMLYAARAALSERDEHAKTHGGTWHLFHQRYVATGTFDQDLYAIATSAQRTREQGDYEAVTPGEERATAIVGGAAAFIAAVERMLGA
jgi:uncharacterized protein (UPF0332 family)